MKNPLDPSENDVLLWVFDRFFDIFVVDFIRFDIFFGISESVSYVFINFDIALNCFEIFNFVSFMFFSVTMFYFISRF